MMIRQAQGQEDLGGSQDSLLPQGDDQRLAAARPVLKRRERLVLCSLKRSPAGRRKTPLGHSERSEESAFESEEA